MGKGPMKRRIICDFVYPPIPQRTLDWCATFDGYEPGDPMGFGSTEAEAIADLEEQWAGYEEWLDTQAAAWDAEVDR